jgi:hypothetical protein
VFAATGVLPDEPSKVDIAARAAQWEFTYASSADQARHEQLIDAAAALHAAEPDLPATPLAVRVLRQALDAR